MTKAAETQEKLRTMNEALVLGSVRQHELTEAAETLNVRLREEIAWRKRVEAALRESEDRYRNLFNSMDEGYCIIEMIFDKRERPVDYRFLEVNRAFDKQSGMHDVAGKRMLEFVTEIEEHWLVNYGKVALTGEPARFANEYKSLDRWFDVYAFKIGEPESRRIAVLFTDITERKRAEEALRESEERFRTLFELGPVAVYSCDASGVIHTFNRRAAELWGRAPALGDTDERFCGSFKLFRPDGSFMPHEQCPMAEVLSGEISEARDAEVLIERPDGSRVVVIVNIRPLTNQRGEVTGAINCFYDITERKQVEEARARLAAIVESSDDAIVSKDINGVITSWNQGAERLFGYSAQEAIGHSIAMLIPRERLDEEPDILARIRRRERVEQYETVRRRKDGTSRDVALTISPIVDSLGDVVGASKIARDITERKRAEQRQKLLTNELAHRGNNLLAVIQSIVSRSLSGTRSLAEAREVLASRIQALARSQSVLMADGFEHAPLAEIVRLEFQAFSDQVNADGPEVMLNPKTTQTFALLVHELATNAAKHGALSRPAGRVSIQWQVEGAGEEKEFRFHWQEHDGPPVKPPTREGFGSLLLEKVVAQDIGAQAKISFAPEGLSYEFRAPLAVVARHALDWRKG